MLFRSNARRQALLRETIQFLQQAIQRNPKSALSKVYLANSQIFLADAVQSSGDRQSAKRLWQQSMLVAEPLLESGQGVVMELYALACRKLSVVAIEEGDFHKAAELVAKLEATMPAIAKSTNARAKFSAAQVAASQGLINARLIRAGARPTVDRGKTVELLRKSAGQWKEASKGIKPTEVSIALFKEVDKIGRAHV